uniref:Mut7-C RNAse domain-containing protein n=1 Tax=Tetradesmus obliquus TaxID=3088 RepID=A0A383WME7_TETOB
MRLNVQLAALLGVSRRAVRMAPDAVVQQVTGFSSGGIPPIGHDSSIKVLVDCRLQGAAAAASDARADNEAQQQQQQQVEGVSRPAGGGWAAVAAATAETVEQHPSGCCTAAGLQETPHSSEGGIHDNAAAAAAGSARAAGGIHDNAAAAAGSATAADSFCNATDEATSSVADGADSRLFLQCGSDAVIQLSFEQLLQLSSGSVADVADVPAVRSSAAAAADAGMSVQGAAAGQQQQTTGPAELASNGAQTFVPRFLVDSMLGRLCRWLRALGVDAEFVETGGKQQAQQQARVQGQPQLLQTLGQQQQGQLIEAIHKAALTEGRLFLTRDTKLAARRDVGGSVYLLATDDAAEQLTEISRHFGIRFDESTAMSRCSVCNAAAFQQIARGAAEALVPPRVMEVVEEFWQCGNCGKVFWMGPKSQAAIDLLSSLFTNGRTVPTPLQSWRQLEPADAQQPAAADTPQPL